MKCPNCESEGNSVTNSRASGNTIRRRRECDICGKRWTTLEIEMSSVDRLEEYMRNLRTKTKSLRDELDVISRATMLSGKGK